MRATFLRATVMPVAVIAAACGHGAATGGVQAQAEFGVGRETQTAPLVQLSTQGAPIYLPGLQRLQGDHVRVATQGLVDQPWGDGLAASLAGSVSLKRAPSNRDFDFGQASVQPSLQAATAWGSFGLGLQQQRLEVASQPFRQGRSLQASWTLASPDGSFWTALADGGRLKYARALRELDAESQSLLLQRHQAHWLHPSLSLDLGLVALRERNRHGFDELSYRGSLVQATLKATLGEHDAWELQLGLARQQLRFDASAFDDAPQRRDRATLLDAAVARELRPGVDLRAAWTQQVNRSTTRLYDNHYRQWTVALQARW